MAKHPPASLGGLEQNTKPASARKKVKPRAKKAPKPRVQAPAKPRVAKKA